jgi:putative heme iron utilization protein
MTERERQAILELLGSQPWVALASCDEAGAPQASMVAVAPARDDQGLLLHLSKLAAHTRNLLRDPKASVVLSEPYHPSSDPQQLARVSFEGEVKPLTPESEGYAQSRQAYLARLPDAEPLFSFADFGLFLLIPSKGRFVGGFGRALSFEWGELFEQKV